MNINTAGNSILRKTGPSAADVIYQNIRAEIVAMKFRPGERLREKFIAERFGVSRTPVREAVLRLGDEGLLEILPQRGTFVAPIRISDVWDAQFLRMAVEIAIVRKLAPILTDESRKRLNELIEDQARAVQRNDTDLFYRLDEAFHAYLAEAAEHLAVWTVVNAAKAHLDRIRFLSLPNKKHVRSVLAEHKNIVKALESGDPDKAEAAHRAHLDKLPKIVASLQAEYPDMFIDAEQIDDSAGTKTATPTNRTN